VREEVLLLSFLMPFKKSNKNSGNAKHRRRNFLERKPENLEKVLPLFLENGNGEVNMIENILVSFQNFQVYAQEMVAFEVFSCDNFVS
jgi:hypothetical protein